MREILFRAKRRDTEKWVEGYYMCLHGINGAEDSHFVIDKHGEYNLIDPDTVCQYTGVTDRNGTKIFENDIVTITGFCPDDEGYGVIQWHDDEAMFVVDADYCRYDFDHISGAELEVIGNVFDNPELIRGVEE